MQSDEAFAKEFTGALQAKRDAGAKDKYECFLPVASDYGYKVSKEELDAVDQKLQGEISEEELGKLAGGTSCLWAATISFTVYFTASYYDDDKPDNSSSTGSW